jgi:hypothetical protein
MRRVGAPAATAGLVAVGSAAYGSLLVLLRGRPSIGVDAGVFLSVAGRLLHGDRLYRDVWDNKDPLFFYVDAAALWVAGWRGPFLLDIFWVATAAAAVWLLLRVLDVPPLARVAGFLAYPLLLTGEWYHAGYSMLAALALAPVAAWLWARGSPTAAGVVVGLGVLFKVSLALVLVAAPVTLFLLGVPVRRNAWHMLGFLTGLAGTLALAAGLLGARGELVPYLHVLRDNLSYANDVLVGTGRIGGVHGHVRAFETLTRHARPVIAVFVLAGAVAVWIFVRGRGRQRTTPLGLASLLLLGVGLATAGTLALTTAWDHHVQMLAYPGALLVVFIVAALNEGVRLRPLRWSAQAAAVAGALLLLGVDHAPNAGWSLSRWTDPADSRTAAALKSVRAAQLPGAIDVSYTHLGQNDEEGHAVFIGGGWTLACARFHQYPFTPAETLRRILRCVDTRHPKLLLVTSSLSDRTGAPAAWHRFVVAGHALLRRDYTRVFFLRHPGGTVTVWERRSRQS